MSMTREQAIKHIEDIRASALKNLGAKYAHGCEGYYRTRIELSDICLTALRPVSREKMERIRGEWKICFEDWRQEIAGDQCSKCGFQHYGTSISQYKFCPNCGAPMTDEAVEMVMKRLEHIKCKD